MHTGVSLYLSNGYEHNARLVEKARRAGVRRAFTSLHIPEERIPDYQREAARLVRLCREAGIELVADVSPRTLGLLGCSSIDDVAQLGLTYLRLDFGFGVPRVAELSRRFHVVFNASTISDDDIAAWRAAGVDLARVAACHNYYPKRWSGLSLRRVASVNDRLKALGVEVMGFVPGDAGLRGPLHEGLPTVEGHRGDTGIGLVRDMLELFDARCDVVLVGDSDVSDIVWRRMGELNRGYVTLHAMLDEAFSYLYGRPQHDRPDSSEFLIRSPESRGWDMPVSAAGSRARTFSCEAGAVVVGNEAYGRYAGEVGIARQPLELDGRDTLAGWVCAEDRPLLPFVTCGRGFVLERPWGPASGWRD